MTLGCSERWGPNRLLSCPEDPATTRQVRDPGERGWGNPAWEASWAARGGHSVWRGRGQSICQHTSVPSTQKAAPCRGPCAGPTAQPCAWCFPYVQRLWEQRKAPHQAVAHWGSGPVPPPPRLCTEPLSPPDAWWPASDMATSQARQYLFPGPTAGANRGRAITY